MVFVIMFVFRLGHRYGQSITNADVFGGNVFLAPVVTKTQYIKEFVLLNCSGQVQLSQPGAVIFAVHKNTNTIVHLAPALPANVVFFAFEIFAIGFANIVKVPTQDDTISVALGNIAYHIREDNRELGRLNTGHVFMYLLFTSIFSFQFILINSKYGFIASKHATDFSLWLLWDIL